MGISTLGRVRFKRRTSHVSNLFSAKNVAVNPIYCVGEGGGEIIFRRNFFFFFHSNQEWHGPQNENF